MDPFLCSIAFPVLFSLSLSLSLSLSPQIEFTGEEGTGLGPSLEFYALVAAELQCRSLAMWLCDDDFPDDQAREVSTFAVYCNFIMKVLRYILQ